MTCIECVLSVELLVRLEVFNINTELWCGWCCVAEGADPAGSLSEGNSEAASPHHDHDENGSYSSGMNMTVLGGIQLYTSDLECHYSFHLCCLQNHLQNHFLSFVQKVGDYTIPAGHQVCVSPTVNHRLQDTWTNRLEFDPDRYLGDNPTAAEKFAYVPFGAGKLVYRS